MTRCYLTVPPPLRLPGATFLCDAAAHTWRYMMLCSATHRYLFLPIASGCYLRLPVPPTSCYPLPSRRSTVLPGPPRRGFVGTGHTLSTSSRLSESLSHHKYRSVNRQRHTKRDSLHSLGLRVHQTVSICVSLPRSLCFLLRRPALVSELHAPNITESF